MQETWVQSLGQEDPLEKETATFSNILAWEIPWTEEHGGLPSMWLQESDMTELDSITTTITDYGSSVHPQNLFTFGNWHITIRGVIYHHIYRPLTTFKEMGLHITWTQGGRNLGGHLKIYLPHRVDYFLKYHIILYINLGQGERKRRRFNSLQLVHLERYWTE